MEMKSKFFYPIPKNKLISRFKPAFKRLSMGYSSTIISLPHTGRTSHLRFITSQKDLLKSLGLPEDKFLTIFVDIDRTDGTFESFLIETLQTLISRSSQKFDSHTLSSLSSKDTYILINHLLETSKSVAGEKNLIFVITLKDRVSRIIHEIDNLMVHIQKNAKQGTINFLWSIDTKIFRNYQPTHLSTSLLDNIYYFPTFDREETIHSILRFANLKGKKLSDQYLTNSQNETGGIAAFFHAYVLFANEKKGPKFSDAFSKTESKIISDIVKESKLSRNVFNKLTTLKSRQFLERKFKKDDIVVGRIKFKNKPKAQEILIFELLKNNLGKPVTRDQIAQTLWGKAWQPKYSDWAIDKAVSRLRKNFVSERFSIITIKNLGYQLTRL